MNFTVKHRAAEGYYEITLRQNISMETVLEIQEKVRNHPDYLAPANLMWDLRSADLKDLTQQDIANALSSGYRRISNKVAVVFDTDFQLAISKQVIAMAGEPTGDTLFTKDHQEARTWLDARDT